jgi:hypothetical protein
MRIRLVVLLPLLALAGGGAFMATNTNGVDMTRSAQHFLGQLSAEQRAIAQLDFETPERFGWHFIPKDQRKGIQLKDLHAAQREAAHQLLRTALSEVGYGKATKIMALERILQELEKSRTGGALRDAERYFFTVFGEPTEQSRWGLSVEGHHLSLNFVVDRGQIVSSTPSFLGSNPAIFKNEVVPELPVGTRVLAKEEQLAFDLLNALSAEQRSVAVIADQAPREIRAAGEVRPPQEPAVGLPVPRMSAEQQEILHQLVLAYLENMPADVQQTRTEEIHRAGTDNVHFAWAGAPQPGIGHYYRVQGPTFLIEFVNTQPDSAGNPANHIHCVWRDLRGDFGQQTAGK